ncbi:MAG TPA: citrate synthase [Microvirga sp.]|jgi:citrate synthase|nr:citrate synthase [Microvirga sp.]
MTAHHPGAAAAHRGFDLVDAAAATARLGISRASLYAYVSRGLIRSFASPRNPRERLYALDDVEALIRRRTRLRRPLVAAATALDWGLPVLETRLTRVEGGRLFYRDRDAVALSAEATLEAVAALLIPGFGPGALRTTLPDPAGTAPDLATASFLSRALRLLADIGAGEDPEPGPAAAAILRLVAGAAGAAGPGPIHAALAQGWNLGPAGADAVRRALVLCADHELSSSAFAVRVAASTGATLRAAIVAGLATLSGPLHGGATDRARDLVEEGATPAGRRRLLERLRAGGRVTGFDHHLYPDGDPRAAAILGRLPRDAGPARRDRALIRAVVAASGQHPSLDVALVALERAHGLPRGAAFALFAVGRTVGWLAHAVEQRAQGSLIRPRARYVAP